MAVKTKSAKKKPAAAKKTASKAAVKAAAVTTKSNPLNTKMTKSQIISTISEETTLSRKQVSAVFGSMANLIQRHMKKKGSGEFSIPEAGVKIRRVRKPATKARKMISPFTGEEITVKAKPAREVVKVTALKSLKDSASS